MRKIVPVVVSTVLTLLVAAPVSAAPKAGRIKGTLRGTVTYSPTNISSGVYDVTVQAAGALSRFGHTKAIWQGQIGLDANLQPMPLAGFGWTLTNAQGSTLHGTITWQATLSTNQPGVYSLTGTLQSSGGTGRLQGATGQGTVSATVNALTRQTTIRIDGFINTVWRRRL